MPATAAARIAASSSRVSLLESVKSLSKAKCRWASRLARNCTSRFSSASSTASTLAKRVGITTAVRYSAGTPCSWRSSLESGRGWRKAVTSWFTTIHRDVRRRAGGQPAIPRAKPSVPRARRARARRPERGWWRSRCRPRTRRWDGAAPSGATLSPGAGRVLGQALQLGETLIHQVIAHVREALIFRVPFQAGGGRTRSSSRPRPLR